MALICWIWRWALGPATWTCRSTLSAIGLVRGHGLDHVGGLGLPVIADVAHAQENLELVGRGGGAVAPARLVAAAAAASAPVIACFNRIFISFLPFAGLVPAPFATTHR